MEVGPPAIRFGEWSLGQDIGEGAAPLAATPPPEGANPGTATAAAGATRLAFTATAAAVWEAGR
jgi:hypothetical protein